MPPVSNLGPVVPTPPPRSRRSVWIAIGVLALVALLMSGGIWYTLRGDHGVATKNSPQEAPLSLSGTLYVTLARATREETRNQGIYLLNFETRALTEFVVKEGVRTRAGRWSPEKGLLMASDMSLRGAPQDNRQIFAYQPNAGFTQLTNSSVRNKRLPSWSSVLNTTIYGVRQTESEEDPISNYAVYMSGESGTDEQLTHGAHPTLSPDGKKLLVLRSDGIYTIDLVSREEKKLPLPLSGPFASYDHFAISHNGELLALTRSNERKVYIYSLSSLEGTMSPLAELDLIAYWPVFSPDDTKLAFERVQKKTETEGTTDIAVYDLISKRVESVIDISLYDHEQTLLTEWR